MEIRQVAGGAASKEEKILWVVYERPGGRGSRSGDEGSADLEI